MMALITSGCCQKVPAVSLLFSKHELESAELSPLVSISCPPLLCSFSVRSGPAVLSCPPSEEGRHVSVCLFVHTKAFMKGEVHLQSLDWKWTCLSTIVSHTTAFTEE